MKPSGSTDFRGYFGCGSDCPAAWLRPSIAAMRQTQSRPRGPKLSSGSPGPLAAHPPRATLSPPRRGVRVRQSARSAAIPPLRPPCRDLPARPLAALPDRIGRRRRGTAPDRRRGDDRGRRPARRHGKPGRPNGGGRSGRAGRQRARLPAISVGINRRGPALAAWSPPAPGSCAGRLRSARSKPASVSRLTASSSAASFGNTATSSVTPASNSGPCLGVGSHIRALHKVQSGLTTPARERCRKRDFVSGHVRNSTQATAL